MGNLSFPVLKSFVKFSYLFLVFVVVVLLGAFLIVAISSGVMEAPVAMVALFDPSLAFVVATTMMMTTTAMMTTTTENPKEILFSCWCLFIFYCFHFDGWFIFYCFQFGGLFIFNWFNLGG